jgi:alpha-1,2-mannosyltransferase
MTGLAERPGGPGTRVTATGGIQAGAPSSPGASAAISAAATPVTAVVVAAVLLALGLRLYQLSRPGYLLGVTEYDDGPYFGSALALLNGAVPYRDFVIVQPPGITVLMLPAALLGKLAGTAWAMAAGRILTALAGAGSVPLVGRLVRHRGVTATVLACGVAAVFPDAIAAAHTVLVEPWLTLFCLLGAAAAFDGDRLTASHGRLAWAGAAFGFAGAVEVWAIFPVMGLLILLLRKPKNAMPFAAAMTAGFGIPVLPFAILAPGRLYNDIVQAQGRAGAVRVPLAAARGLSRLREMTGLTSLHPAVSVQILAAIGILTIIFGSMAAGSVISDTEPAELDWFAVAAFAVISAAFLLPPQFYYHFSAFLAPFLALAIALGVTRLKDAAWPAGGGKDRGRLAAGLAGALIVAMTMVQVSHEAQTRARMAGPALTAVRQLIPPGACLVTDQASVSIAINRFASTRPGCPLLIDPVGTGYALTGGHDPRTSASRYPELVAIWHTAFSHAQYVWLSRRQGRRIPWTRALEIYFRDRFSRVLVSPAGALYQRAVIVRPLCSPATAGVFQPSQLSWPLDAPRCPPEELVSVVVGVDQLEMVVQVSGQGRCEGNATAVASG